MTNGARANRMILGAGVVEENSASSRQSATPAGADSSFNRSRGIALRAQPLATIRHVGVGKPALVLAARYELLHPKILSRREDCSLRDSKHWRYRAPHPPYVTPSGWRGGQARGPASYVLRRFSRSMAGEDGYRVTLYQLAGPLACPPTHPLGVTMGSPRSRWAAGEVRAITLRLRLSPL
jgi:hypothetical protein